MGCEWGVNGHGWGANGHGRSDSPPGATLAAPSPSTGPLERCFSLQVARQRPREALKSRCWSFLGAPQPLRSTLPCTREREFRKNQTSLLDGLPKPSGTHFGTLWAALGRLLGRFWALLGRPGLLLERSWGTPGGIFGALLPLLRRTWDRRRPPDPPGTDFQRILGRLGSRSGWFW